MVSPSNSNAHNAPKTGLDAPCESRNSRARAPPFVAPPSSTSGAWGGFGVLLYIVFLGPRRWILVSQRSPTSKYDFELEKRVLYALQGEPL
jgi:hypothetical protein